MAGMIASSFSCTVKIANCIILYSYQLVPTKWQGVSFGFCLFVANTTKLGDSISSAYLNCL